MSQTTLTDHEPTLTGADSPEIGVSLDEFTHYAHVRYAATNHPGVVWYDPRDGREDYSLGRDVTLDELDRGDAITTRVAIRAFRPSSHGDPAARYVVKTSVAKIEVLERFTPGDGAEEIERVGSYGRSDVFDSLEAARDHLRADVDGYADAPRRNAVTDRPD